MCLVEDLLCFLFCFDTTTLVLGMVSSKSFSIGATLLFAELALSAEISSNSDDVS